MGGSPMPRGFLRVELGEGVGVAVVEVEGAVGLVAGVVGEEFGVAGGAEVVGADHFRVVDVHRVDVVDGFLDVVVGRVVMEEDDGAAGDRG